MKTLKNPLPVILFFIVMLGQLPAVTAQNLKPSKEATIKKIVDSQQYVFHAQYANPMNGRQRYLTSDYVVNVTKDTIVSDLPYFGRAYSAPINTTDGGIKFTSTNFEYKLVARKKGGWDIAIKPKDVQEVALFTMTVFDNGSASLQVSSTNRQPISFNGYVTENKSNK